jgi:hypothetical protein
MSVLFVREQVIDIAMSPEIDKITEFEEIAEPRGPERSKRQVRNESVARLSARPRSSLRDPTYASDRALT